MLGVDFSDDLDRGLDDQDLPVPAARAFVRVVTDST
jgi:hypothetical protein